MTEIPHILDILLFHFSVESQIPGTIAILLVKLYDIKPGALRYYVVMLSCSVEAPDL